MPPPPLQRQQQDVSYKYEDMTGLRTSDLQHRESYERTLHAPRLRDVTQQLSDPGRLRQMNDASLCERSRQPERSAPILIDHPSADNDTYMPYPLAHYDPRRNVNLGKHNEEDALASERFLPGNFAPQASAPPRDLYQASFSPETSGASMNQRQPLRPLPISQNGGGSLGSSHFNFKPKAATSPYKEWRNTTASISSPFFRNGKSNPRSTPLARPPTRGSNVSQASKVYGQQWSTAQKQNNSINTNIYDRSRDSERPQLLHGSWDQNQDPETPRSDRETRPRLQGHTQKERDQASRQYLTPANRFYASQQFVPSPRGRITLPPYSSGARNPEFAGMRGVREGQYERETCFHSHRSPGYIGSHPLFSTTSRRSVRR